MLRIIGTVLALLAFAAASQAHAMPQNRYIDHRGLDTEALKKVNTLVLLEVPDPEAFYYGGGRGGWKSEVFGIVGMIAETVELGQNAGRYGSTDFPRTLQTYLEQFLSENNYQVIDREVERKDRFDLLDDYSKLDVPGADAYLDVAPVEIGYIYEPKLGGAKIRPVATVIVRLVAADDQQVIYAKTFQYGYQVNIHSQSRQILPPDNHFYESVEALDADRPRAVERLNRALEVLAFNIARDITGGEFVSYLTPTLEDLADAEADPDAMKFLGTAATEVAMKTYDEKLWQQSGSLAGGSAEERASAYIKLRSKRLADEEKREKLKELSMLTREGGNAPQAIVDVSGVYVSEITISGAASSTKQFMKKNNQREIRLEQTGNTITGTDDSGSFEVNGSREGSRIRFYIVRANEIVGDWEVNADASRIEGNWKTNGGGGASGQWNLTRVGEPARIIDGEAALNAGLATGQGRAPIELLGVYDSYVRANQGGVSRGQVVLAKSGEEIRGKFIPDDGSRIEGSYTSANKIGFHWTFATARYDRVGAWDVLDAGRSSMRGTWQDEGNKKGIWKLDWNRPGTADDVAGLEFDSPLDSMTANQRLPVFDVTGAYFSNRIRQSWALQNKPRLRIRLEQSPDSSELTGNFYNSISGPIRGEINGDKIEITWEAGNCNSGEGSLSVTDASTLTGTLLCRSQGMQRYDVVFQKE